MTNSDLESLRKSIVRALLGNKETNLFGIKGEIEGETIVLAAYFTVRPTEDDIEEFQCIGSEVIADYPDPYLINEKWEIGKPEIEEGKSVWVENII
jgi:hypothetical protein